MDWLAVLKEIGALIVDDHIVFVSWEHSDNYVNLGKAIRRPKLLRAFAKAIAERHKDREIKVVVGAATGGAQLAQLVALELSDLTGEDVFVGIADKEGDGFIFKRGYEEGISGGNVLIVDDTITTGKTLKQMVALVRSHHGNIVAIAGMVRRKEEVTAGTFGVPELTWELDLILPSWKYRDCKYCHDPAYHRPINQIIGHGRHFPDWLEAERVAGREER